MMPNNRINYSPERRVPISLLLTASAMLLWAHSIVYARFEIGYFGLIHGLPLTFFLALAFLVAASAILWTSPRDHGRLLCLQLLLFISILWLVPTITNGFHSFTSLAYRNLGLVDYIVEHGVFDSSKLFYQSWPGSFILTAMASLIGEFNLKPVLHIFPLFIQFLYLLPLYVFLKNTLGEHRPNSIWFGCWLFYLASWLGQDYFSPQAMALFLLLILLYLVTTPYLLEKSSRGYSLLAIALILFATLVITHLLTALAAIIIFTMICLLKKSKVMAVAVLVCILLFITWDFSGGAHYIKYIQSQPSGSELLTEPGVTTGEAGIINLNPEAIARTEVTGHFTGSPAHIAVAKTRFLFSGIFVLVGLAGLIFFRATKRSFKTAITILAITLTPTVLLFLSGNYGEELLHRLYLFTLPGMAYFGAVLLDLKYKLPLLILSLLLAVGGPLHVISHYGNQEIEYFPPGIVNGLRFFDTRTSGGYVVGAWPIGLSRNADQYQRLPMENIERANNMTTTGQPMSQEMPLYFAISRQYVAEHEFLRGDTTFIKNLRQDMDKARNCALIYYNPDFELSVCDNY